MAGIQKCFRISEEDLKKYEELKNIARIKSEQDFFVRMLDYTESFLKNQLISANFLQENLQQKDEMVNKAMLQLGMIQEKANELSNLLEEVKQKSVFKRILWAISLSKGPNKK